MMQTSRRPCERLKFSLSASWQSLDGPQKGSKRVFVYPCAIDKQQVANNSLRRSLVAPSAASWEPNYSPQTRTVRPAKLLDRPLKVAQMDADEEAASRWRFHCNCCCLLNHLINGSSETKASQGTLAHVAKLA